MSEGVFVNGFITCFRDGTTDRLDGRFWEMTLIGVQRLPDAVLKEIAGGSVHVQFRRRKAGRVISTRPRIEIRGVPYVRRELPLRSKTHGPRTSRRALEAEFRGKQ